MKKFFLILTLIILNLCTYAKVNALIEPTPEFYVNDYANILSEETKNFIMNNSVKLASATQAQIVVVTVQSLEGQDIETYATDLFRYFGIGDKQENNGLLILIALEERDIKIEPGYGLEEVITDGLSGRYLDKYFIPYAKDNKWDEGIKNVYSAFYEKICEFYDIDVSNIKVESINGNNNNKLHLISIIIGIIIGSILSIFVPKIKNIIYALISVLLILLIPNYIFYIYLSKIGSLKLFINCIIPEIYSIVLTVGILRALLNTSHSSGGYYDGGFSSGGGFSSSHSSGGSFSGGGGSSGGGGASRHF